MPSISEYQEDLSCSWNRPKMQTFYYQRETFKLISKGHQVRLFQKLIMKYYNLMHCQKQCPGTMTFPLNSMKGLAKPEYTKNSQ